MWRCFRLPVPGAFRSRVSTRSYGLIPMALEHTSRGELARADDISKLLFKQRIIFINGHIADDTAGVVVPQLLHLEFENPLKPIHLYINSSSGVVSAGLAIYDTMQYIRSPVNTLCIGQATSMASLLLAAGTAGQRQALPNARVMIHQLSEVSEVPFEFHTPDILKMHELLNGIYAKHCGQLEVEKNMDDMSAEDAKKFGLIDEVVKHCPE